MIGKLTEKASESVWKKLGKEVLETAVKTLVEEGVEASVEIWKKRKLKIQEDELEARAEAGKAGVEAGEGSMGERRDYPGSGEEDSAVETPEDEQDEVAETSSRGPARAGIQSFSSYVGRQ